MRDDHYSVFLLVAVASMIASPLLVAGSRLMTSALIRIPALRKFDFRSSELDAELPLENHVIIAGYGLNGRNLATSLQTFELPFAVLEMNPTTVQAARRRGENVFFGDCSRVEILRKLHLNTARGLVLAISDAQATRQAVQIARHENPRIHIIVRTKYMTEIDVLRELGANEIIAEEFETSLEVLALTLRLFETPDSAIDRIIDRFRADAYRALRSDLPSAERQRLLRELAPEFEFETFRVEEGAAAIGKTLRELDLRARSGAMLLAVRRDTVLTAVPTADFQLQPDDLLVLAGDVSQIADAIRVLVGSEPPAVEQAESPQADTSDTRDANGTRDANDANDTRAP